MGRLVFIVFICFCSISCSADKTRTQHNASLQEQAYEYERQSRYWRQQGNHQMADFFECKAQETRQLYDNYNVNVTDVVLDIIYDTNNDISQRDCFHIPESPPVNER